jgi:hypothetical protein
VPVRVRVWREHILPHIVVLVIPLLPVRSMHTCYAWDAGVGAGMHACAYGASALVLVFARVIVRSSDRGGVSVCIAAGIAVFFLREYGGCVLRRSGYTFRFGYALARREVGWRWRIRADVLWVHVHSARPLPCSLSVSLTILLCKVGQIAVFCTI